MRDAERERELGMCQQALLNAVQVFLRSVDPVEQGRRVDAAAFSDVFGERLIPMQPNLTEYVASVL